jgi:hypothetical protein
MQELLAIRERTAKREIKVSASFSSFFSLSGFAECVSLLAVEHAFLDPLYALEGALWQGC